MAKYEHGDRVTIDDEKDIDNGKSGTVLAKASTADFYVVTLDNYAGDKVLHGSRLKKEKTKYSIGFFNSRDRSRGKQPKVFEVSQEVFDKFKLELETLDELDGETDGVVSTVEVTD